MKTVSKKLKQKKRSDTDRATECAGQYPIIHVVQNTDMPNQVIQMIRKDVKCRILFIKKSMFQRQYPAFNFEGSYFLVFATENISDRLESITCPDFLKEGETISEKILIPAGVVRNKKVVDLLENTIPQGSNFIIENEYVVCDQGDCATEKQAKILQALNKRLGQSNIKVISVRDSLN